MTDNKCVWVYERTGWFIKIWWVKIGCWKKEFKPINSRYLGLVRGERCSWCGREIEEKEGEK